MRKPLFSFFRDQLSRTAFREILASYLGTYESKIQTLQGAYEILDKKIDRVLEQNAKILKELQK